MKTRSYIITIIITFLMLIQSCKTPSESISKKDIEDKVKNSCYEILTPFLKTEQIQLKKKKSLLEEESKKYSTIGTAFAIGRNRFITTFNTLSPLRKEINEKPFFIRDYKGNIYKLSDIISFHSKDNYIIFSVDDFESPDYFKIKSNKYKVHEKVYHAGFRKDSYIQFSKGVILDDIKIDKKNVIRSSIFKYSLNPVGGPLIDEDFNLIGMVVQKEEDKYTLSFPAERFLDYNPKKGIVDLQLKYNFDLINGKESEFNFKYEMELPKSLQEVKSEISEVYNDLYIENMNAFFDQSGGLFPEGDGSYTSLYNSISTPYLQLLYKRSGEDFWRFSNLERNKIKMDNSGSIHYSEIGNHLYINLIKPENISCKELYSSSKSIMDRMLESLNIILYQNGKKGAIKSYGEPFKEESFLDRYGRKWNLGYWYIGVGSKEQVNVLMWSPTPSGLVAVSAKIKGPELVKYNYDLRKTADLIFIPYTASIKNWQDFLSHSESENSPYYDLKIERNGKYQIYAESSEFSINIKKMPFEINDNSILSLNRDFYPYKNDYIWGLRKIRLQDESEKNEIVSYRLIKPEGNPEDTLSKRWELALQNKTPYNEKKIIIGDKSRMTGTLSESPDQNMIDTLSLSLWGRYNDQTKMKELLEELKNSIRIKY